MLEHAPTVVNELFGMARPACNKTKEHPRSIIEEVATDIRRATNAPHPPHQVEPQDSELLDNPRDRYIRLQD